MSADRSTLPMIGSITQPTTGSPVDDAAGRCHRARRAPEAPRPQYIQLKANVHRKLLNRLNLEALASVDRQRAEARDPHAASSS